MPATDLRQHLASRGAVYEDDRGVALPAHFGDPAAEYGALRQSAAVIDLGFRTLVVARGADRVAFLQGMLTNDVAALVPGGGCPALLLTIQGRPVADVRVAVTEDAVLLDVDVRLRDAFVGCLERLLVADDVELGPPVVPVTLVGVEGPEARAVVGGGGTRLEPFEHATVTVAGVACRVQRGGELDGEGVVLHVPTVAVAAVWDAAVAAGARPCGMLALEGRRIELGRPRVGLDGDEKALALELPVDAAVSQTKGCYLGQEVVARGTARGQVQRLLVPVLLDGSEPPRGAALVHDGKQVGVLTSVGHAFGVGRGAALALVRREYGTPGIALAVPHGNTVTTARVARAPLA